MSSWIIFIPIELLDQSRSLEGKGLFLSSFLKEGNVLRVVPRIICLRINLIVNYWKNRKKYIKMLKHSLWKWVFPSISVNIDPLLPFPQQEDQNSKPKQVLMAFNDNIIFSYTLSHSFYIMDISSKRWYDLSWGCIILDNAYILIMTDN